MTKLMIAVATFLASGCVAQAQPKARRIAISLTEKGWEPKKITVKKGESVTLVFTRKTEKTCAKEVQVFYTDKDKIEKKLPLNEPVEIPTRFEKSGELGFTCGMNMISGVIMVE